MSMNRYAGSGPIMAGLAAFGDLGPSTSAPQPAAYPSLSNEDLTRMIENLADQVSELAAQNVELRARLTKAEERLSRAWVWVA